ncbi:hypothetical protein A4U43_C02F11520 [Asparagus officinalis]|uniref:Uncharacterized protein n=1 Tax=Asparagus officinalis TaxID=4686 RepID=A0A5P1FHQ6_ASPOF|nr:hypothetical protein A4U43_C02F11520 [Asparagus officinalis]
MSTILKLSCLSLAILYFSRGAFGECNISSIKLSQSSTGVLVQGKIEYEVTLSNDCICSQSSLYVSCDGFKTTEPVDPNVFKVEGSRCIINNGLPVFQDNPVKFKYAWDHQFDLRPVQSQVNCS